MIYSKMLKTCLCCVFLLVMVNCEDTKCVTSNLEEGRCINLDHCPSAKRDLEFKIYPQICSFNGTSKIPSICCLEEDYSNKAKIQSSSPTVEKDDGPSRKELKKAPDGLKVGHKAWAKCVEYQDKAVSKIQSIPLLPSPTIQLISYCQNDRYDDVKLVIGGGGGIDAHKNEFPHMPLIPSPTIHRSSYCRIDQYDNVELVVGGGGIDARKNEFPHMALLGYGNNFTEADFACGGSLISEKFILTAGHCTFTRDLGNVSFAVFGILKRTDVPHALPENIYTVKRIIRHPEYAPSSKYHDIALLELDREVPLNEKVLPACLHVGNDVNDQRAYATGWGVLGYRREIANVLQNVPLWKVTDEVCNEKFPKHRQFRKGYDKDTQMCYGDDGQPRDTCEGDSGGPLQIINKDIYCTYLILGVTSFGHARCAHVGSPGIYTRVSYYVPWIESVVWP